MIRLAQRSEIQTLSKEAWREKGTELVTMIADQALEMRRRSER